MICERCGRDKPESEMWDLDICKDCAQIEFESIQEMANSKTEPALKRQHPLYIVKNILSYPSSHSLGSAHAIRNLLILGLRDFFWGVGCLSNNIIICREPKANTSQYEAVYVRVLRKPYPKQIREFQAETRDLMSEVPREEGDERTLLQRFCRVFVGVDMSEPCKELLWRFHIDYVYFDGKSWQARYTGKRLKKEVVQNEKRREIAVGE